MHCKVNSPRAIAYGQRRSKHNIRLTNLIDDYPSASSFLTFIASMHSRLFFILFCKLRKNWSMFFCHFIVIFFVVPFLNFWMTIRTNLCEINRSDKISEEKLKKKLSEIKWYTQIRAHTLTNWSWHLTKSTLNVSFNWAYWLKVKVNQSQN